MKNSKNFLGQIATDSREVCEMSGCDPDFILFSSVIVPNALALDANFPGGDKGAGNGLWFFSQLSALENATAFQSSADVISLSTMAGTNNAIVAQLMLPNFQISHVGVQVVSLTGSSLATALDIKTITENGLFEAWFPAPGNTISPPFIRQEPSIEQPIVALPSIMGMFGSDNTTGQGVATNGIPGPMNAMKLKQPIRLVRDQLIAARITFPPTTFTYRTGAGVLTPVVVGSPAVVAPVAVRLSMYGVVSYS